MNTIARTVWFKSLSSEGELCKTYKNVCNKEHGYQMQIRRLILDKVKVDTPENFWLGARLIKRYKNCRLYEQNMAFLIDSFMRINDIYARILQSYEAEEAERAEKFAERMRNKRNKL